MTPAAVSAERRHRLALAAIFVVALAIRAVIGVWADGRGEMKGLAHRYEQDAYAMIAGYGFVRPVERQPPQVDFFVFKDSLEARGERLDPSDVPVKDPARWRPSRSAAYTTGASPVATCFPGNSRSPTTCCRSSTDSAGYSTRS